MDDKKKNWSEWKRCKYCEELHLKEDMINEVCFACQKIIKAFCEDMKKQNKN